MEGQRFVRPPHVPGFKTVGEVLEGDLLNSLMLGALRAARPILADIAHPDDREAAEALAKVDVAISTAEATR